MQISTTLSLRKQHKVYMGYQDLCPGALLVVLILIMLSLRKEMVIDKLLGI